MLANDLCTCDHSPIIFKNILKKINNIRFQQIQYLPSNSEYYQQICLVTSNINKFGSKRYALETVISMDEMIIKDGNLSLM